MSRAAAPPAETEVARGAPRRRPLLWGAFLLYVLMLILVGSHHQPWFDEAQAWLIARDNGLGQLFLTGVRYEGTPALWHLLLWAAMRAGLPYSGFWLVSATLAAIGAGVVLLRAPLPAWARIGTVFSYFFAYQYAIVARSYALDLALIPLLATVFPERVDRPLLYFSLLALAANTNAHSFVVAAVLALEAALAARGRALRGDLATLSAFALFGALALAAIAQAYPPHDINFLIRNPRAPPYQPILHALELGEEAFVERWDVFAGTRPDGASRLIGGCLTLLVLAPAMRLFQRAGRLWLALGLFGGLIAFSALKYGNVWHAGIIYLSFIFCLWTSWSALAMLRPLERKALLGGLAALMAVQAWSAAAAAARDFEGLYSPARRVAEILPRSRGGVAGRLGVSGFKAFAIQPYFARNVFANYHDGAPRPAYYVWSKTEQPIPGVGEPEWKATLAKGYDRVLLSVFNMMGLNGPYRFSRDARLAGYCLEAAFPGELVWKTYVLETDDMVVFRRCPPFMRRSAAEILRPELEAGAVAFGTLAGSAERPKKASAATISSRRDPGV